jgi:hypothetical protein
MLGTFQWWRPAASGSTAMGGASTRRRVNGTSPWSTRGEDKATRARGVAVTGDNRWR